MSLKYPFVEDVLQMRSSIAHMLQKFLFVAPANRKGKIADVDTIIAEAVDLVERYDI